MRKVHPHNVLCSCFQQFPRCERLCYTGRMKLTAQAELLPTPQQAEALKRTPEQANKACNTISAQAWETGTFRRYDLHRLVYYKVRAAFDLSAQVVVRCIAKVADAYRLDQKTERAFKPMGAITFDRRILCWKLGPREVSLWTVAGRLHIPFTCGERQWELLQGQRGETDLVFRDGSFYLRHMPGHGSATPAVPGSPGRRPWRGQPGGRLGWRGLHGSSRSPHQHRVASLPTAATEAVGSDADARRAIRIAIEKKNNTGSPLRSGSSALSGCGRT